jgi:uncharacterized protein (TIGR04222 family)
MAVFLVLIGVAVAVSSVTLLVGMVRLGRRSDGGSGPAVLTDVMEAAFLGGGPGRVADAALAEMRADGRLTIGGPGIVLVQQAVSRHPVEASVLREHAAAPTGALRTLRLAVMRSLPVQAIGDTLAARGLLLRPEQTRPWRKWALFHALGCLVALPVSFGLTLAANFSGSDPAAGARVGLVVMPVAVVGLVIGLACSASLVKKRVTGAGQRALRQFRDARSAVSTAHLVAAHGPRALPDPVLRRQLQMAGQPVRANRRYAARTVSAGTAASTAATSGPAVWCASSDPGSGSGCGAGASSSCGGGSSCGGSSGSSCGGSSGSSCGGSSGSSCGGGGSSCGGGN